MSISPDGEMDIKEFREKPSLEYLQGVVGGFIERVPLFNWLVVDDGAYDAVVYCNANGKINGEPENEDATILWGISQRRDGILLEDVLVGTVVILIGDVEFLAHA